MNETKTEDAMVTTRQLFSEAEDRVTGSDALRQYADFILADWPDGADHWGWVATAPEQEIIEWCEAGQ
jgi:hypothetical protein